MTGRIITADEAKTLREAATEGPWCWFGNTANRSIYLATIDRGRQFVMAFYRWGMRDATPAFQGADHVMHNAEEYVQYEVAPDATDKADERLYRHDFQGLRHPDAELIAAAPDLAFTVEQQAAQIAAVVTYCREQIARENEPTSDGHAAMIRVLRADTASKVLTVLGVTE